MPVAFITHPDCGRHDTGWGHPEHVGRLRAIPRALREDPALFHQLLHHEARHATPNELQLAHDPTYIERVQTLSTAGGGPLDADTVVSEGSWGAARAAAGALLDAVDMTLDGRALRSFAAVRPPGHHALRARGMGFCLFGSVAVAAHYARARHAVDRVLIVDWDVHHGNGTQALVEAEANIRFVSMHQWPWYPGTGPASDRGRHNNVWNVPMPPGLPAAQYREAFQRAIDAATTGWKADLLFVSSGFDSLAGDPLGGFTLELEDVDILTRDLVARAKSICDGRLISALEGGYAPERLAQGVLVHMRAML
ncbi:MAG: histone deacetylase family protein [Gemmatimonadaceae bacterium]